MKPHFIFTSRRDRRVTEDLCLELSKNRIRGFRLVRCEKGSLLSRRSNLEFGLI